MVYSNRTSHNHSCTPTWPLIKAMPNFLYHFDSNMSSSAVICVSHRDMAFFIMFIYMLITVGKYFSEQEKLGLSRIRTGDLWKILFILHYICTQTIYIYQKLHEMNGFVEMRAIFQNCQLFYTPCISFNTIRYHTHHVHYSIPQRTIPYHIIPEPLFISPDISISVILVFTGSNHELE